PVAAGPVADARWGPAIDKTLAAAPRPAGLTAAFESGPAIKLAVAGGQLKGADLKDAHFFPLANGAIDNAKPQTGSFGPDGVTLTLVKGEANGPAPAGLAGVLAVGGKGYEIAAAQGALPAGAAGQGLVRHAAPAAGDKLSLVPAVLFARVGGLILNLMPC